MKCLFSRISVVLNDHGLSINSNGTVLRRGCFFGLRWFQKGLLAAQSLLVGFFQR